MDVGFFSPERLITDLDGACEARRIATEEGLTVVLTNGCFDLAHTGHVRFLHDASKLGDLLFVGINSDRTVEALKGGDRPIISEFDRAYMVASLGCVDVVFIFDTLDFLDPIDLLVPDVYVKGGDYTLDTLDSNERTILEKLEVKIRILPLVHGASTTNLVDHIKSRGTKWKTQWPQVRALWGKKEVVPSAQHA